MYIKQVQSPVQQETGKDVKSVGQNSMVSWIATLFTLNKNENDSL
jgi:hypothetical protein